MAYTPINWQTGDTITAEKMNKMDNGWGASSTQLFSETVTTADIGGYYGAVISYVATAQPPTTLVINYDGTEYICEDQGNSAYGASSPSFSDYPFMLQFTASNTQLITSTAGSHTISVGSYSMEVSDNFNTAVNSCVNSPMLCVSGTTTFAEMSEASSLGRLMYFKPYGNEGTETFIIAAFTNIDATFIPTNSQITASFNNGIFTVTITD